MSLTFLKSNNFDYQNIPSNSVIYRSTTSSFATIPITQGILMVDVNNTLKFGIPTASELIPNYTNNTIVMTSNNKLVPVPVSGTSSNKLLRQINGNWQIVDFSVEYIKPSLYNSLSWQLWIADSDINVINIPKQDISNQYWGVKYDNSTNTFIIANPNSQLIQQFNNEYYIPYNDSTAFTIVSNRTVIYSNTSSNHTSLYTCIFSSNKNQLFDGTFSSYVQFPISINQYLFKNGYNTYIYGGFYIENINAYTSLCSCITLVQASNKQSVSIYGLQNFPNIMHLVSKDKLIIPFQNHISCANLTTFPNIYMMIQKASTNDTSVWRWFFPRNLMNIFFNFLL